MKTFFIPDSEEERLSFLENYLSLVSHCGFIVMLEGNELSEWKMDSTLSNSMNNEVIWQGMWPEEPPEFYRK